MALRVLRSLPYSAVVLFAVLLGCGRGPTPAAPGGPAASFRDVTAAAGIRFQHFNGMRGKKLLPETMGGGVVVLDFDADGRPDLFFVNGRGWPGSRSAPTHPELYRNRGGGSSRT